MPDLTNPCLGGDVNIAAVASLFADESRGRILMTLNDCRELPASVIATEIGISATSCSNHLKKLLEARLITVRNLGRNRYYRLSNDDVGYALEALAALAPKFVVNSLKESTRAAALRSARACYDHMAGRFAVSVCQALIDAGAVYRTDGRTDLLRRDSDPLSAGGAPRDLYGISGTAGTEVLFMKLGVDIRELLYSPGRRPILRPCVDWSEQKHHFGGRLGAALLHAWVDLGWISRRPKTRALKVTERGRKQLDDILSVTIPV